MTMGSKSAAETVETRALATTAKEVNDGVFIFNQDNNYHCLSEAKNVRGLVDAISVVA
jgi:hypothetical protein